MIPKIIHYCWFGGNKLSKQAKKCLKSWKKYCPDYQIIEWNEKNFDITTNVYVKKAYEMKKYAFVSDVARLYALTTMGGVYFDTDYELKKNIDFFCSNSFLGWESDTIIGTAIIGAEKGDPLLKEFLAIYDNIEFKKEDGLYLTNTVRLTTYMIPRGLIQDNSLQEVSSIKIYPKQYFYPKDQNSGVKKITKETCGIHHFVASHVSKKDRVRQKIYQIIYRIFGEKFAKKLYSIFGRDNI